MDIFRHFFGLGHRPPDGGLDDGAPERTRPDFDVHSDPLQVHRYFEEEIGRLLRSFGFAGVPDDEGRREEPPRSLREQFLRSGYEDRRDEAKVDRDLDDRVRSGRLDAILRDEQPPAAPPSSWNFFTGRSEVVRTVTHPDGSVETERTSRDSEGNEETTTCRALGDKQYCVTRRRTRDGREETSERLVNIDEDEKGKFLGDKNIGEGEESRFPFDRFFK